MPKEDVLLDPSTHEDQGGAHECQEASGASEEARKELPQQPDDANGQAEDEDEDTGADVSTSSANSVVVVMKKEDMDPIEQALVSVEVALENVREALGTNKAPLEEGPIQEETVVTTTLSIPWRKQSVEVLDELYETVVVPSRAGHTASQAEEVAAGVLHDDECQPDQDQSASKEEADQPSTMVVTGTLSIVTPGQQDSEQLHEAGLHELPPSDGPAHKDAHEEHHPAPLGAAQEAPIIDQEANDAGQDEAVHQESHPDPLDAVSNESDVKEGRPAALQDAVVCDGQVIDEPRAECSRERSTPEVTNEVAIEEQLTQAASVILSSSHEALEPHLEFKARDEAEPVSAAAASQSEPARAADDDCKGSSKAPAREESESAPASGWVDPTTDKKGESRSSVLIWMAATASAVALLAFFVHFYASRSS